MQKLTFTFFSCVILAHNSAWAEDSGYALKAKPQQCVVLHQGQNCRKSVRVIWRAATTGDYCLIRVDNKTRLQCWQNSVQGEYQFAFDSNTSVTLYLTKQVEAEALASDTVSVAWVYESGRNSRATWRLF